MASTDSMVLHVELDSLLVTAMPGLANMSDTRNASLMVVTITPLEAAEGMCDQYTSTMLYISTLLCIMGIVSNAMSLAILSRIGRHSITFFLLKVLAASDAFYLSTYLVGYSIVNIVYEHVGHSSLQYISYMAWGVFPLSSMALTVSIWSTAMVTVYRYLTLCAGRRGSPVISTRAVYIQVIVIIICSIVMDVPKFFEREIVQVTEGDTTYTILQKTALWNNAMYQLIYKNIFMVVARKLVPILVTAILTYKLVQLLVERSHQRSQQLRKSSLSPSAAGSLRRRRRDGSESVTRVLVVVAVVFVICQTPMAIYPLIRLVSETSLGCPHHYMFIAILADTLCLFNSAVNFFIFYPFIPTFRRVLWFMMCPCITKERRLSDDITLAYRQSSIRTTRSRTISSTILA